MSNNSIVTVIKSLYINNQIDKEIANTAFKINKSEIIIYYNLAFNSFTRLFSATCIVLIHI